MQCQQANTASELENLKQIDCQMGEIVNGDCKVPCSFINARNESAGAKTKRKARSTRRRLNAMLSNASLHFSDTDSEGELAAPRVVTPSHCPKTVPKPASENFLNPIISVTADGSDGSSYCGDRRNSFLENLTDVDEIYTSEPENGGTEKARSIAPRGSLAVVENHLQGETDLEDVSNDEDEVIQPPIFVEPRGDILRDFNGETITTKEGDGPFSIEVRNQMSIDESKAMSDTPDIVIMPTTDSEDMEASDDDEDEGASGQRLCFEDLDEVDPSQIVMTNVDKTEQLLTVREPEEAIGDCHTDIEDLE